MENYSQRAAISWVLVGTYGFMILVVLLLWWGRELNDYGAGVLLLLLGIYLARFLSIRYVVTAHHLAAKRLFGSRRVELKSIRRVDQISLREISPVSWTGGWGWRSRMWSPIMGAFDNLSTVYQGLMVHGEGVPFLISPTDREAFLKVLEERRGNRL